LQLLDLQTAQLAEMESQMNHIAQVGYHVYWQYLVTGHLLIKNRIDFIYIP
jgi:hypothetical protein